MKTIYLPFLFCFLFSLIASATQFIPLSIEKQVAEADFAVEATLKSQSAYKNSSGLIISNYIFAVGESYGFTESEFHLEIPGGTFNGVTTVIDGGPHFLGGEKVFLLLKKVESKIYLSNFSLGQYKIIEIDGKKFYRSEIFGHDPRIGIISKEKMKILMHEKWNYAVNVQASRPVIMELVNQLPGSKKAKDVRRFPAGVVPQENNIINWRFVLLGCLILISGILILRKNKKL